MPFSTIDDECMKDLKKGLRCIQLLEVSEEFKFNESLMADIFLSEDRTRMPMRPFNLFGYVLLLISIAYRLTYNVATFESAYSTYVRIYIPMSLLNDSEELFILLKFLEEFAKLG